MEFDVDRALDKLIMIWYFREGLKLLIKVKIEQQNRTSTHFKEIVQKAVNVEAKADLQSSIMVWDANRPKESRPKETKSTDGKALVLS